MMFRRLALIVAIAAIASAPVWADAGDQKIRFGIQHMSPTGDLRVFDSETFDVTSPEPGTIDIDPLIIEVEADAATGLFFEWEFMTTDAIGIAVGLASLNHDVETNYSGDAIFTPFDTGLEPESGSASGSQDGEISVMPLTVGVNFHFVQNQAVDVYAGPYIGYVFFGDLELDSGSVALTFPSYVFTDTFSPEDIPIKDGFAYGALVGIDAAFGGSGWFYHASAGYMIFSAEIDEPGGVELDIDPFVVRTGVGIRF